MGRPARAFTWAARSSGRAILNDPRNDFASGVRGNTPEAEVAYLKIATGIGTLVFFMGMKNLRSIVDNLVSNGRSPDTPVALIQWGTRTDQRVVTGTLEDIVARVDEAKLGPSWSST